MSLRAPCAGKVHVIDPVPPVELLYWTASSDVMVMAVQPRSENHRFMTPQKLWEALAAGVPVVAADLPGMAAVVHETGCGVVCDPTSPGSIADAIRRVLGADPRGSGRWATAAWPPPTIATTGRSSSRSSTPSMPDCWASDHDRAGERAHDAPPAAGPDRHLSQGTSEFDSRAQRIARTCAAAGDTVTIYSRYLAELPAEEHVDGYRIVRLPLSESNARQAAAAAAAAKASAAEGARASQERQAWESRPGRGLGRPGAQRSGRSGGPGHDDDASAHRSIDPQAAPGHERSDERVPGLPTR